MDKFQAVFEVLYLLAVIDESFERVESDALNDFIRNNFGQGNFDTHQVVRSLDALSSDERNQRIGFAAGSLKEACNVEELNHVLDFAYGIITADRKMTDEEALAFTVVADLWSIDIQRFIGA